MDYIYFYLCGTIVYVLVWLVLFLKRPDLRKEMLVMSVLFGIGALVTAKLYLADWWRPATVTGTAVGIEDFLFGFSAAGIAAVCYEELFRKRLRRDRRLQMGLGGSSSSRRLPFFSSSLHTPLSFPSLTLFSFHI